MRKNRVYSLYKGDNEIAFGTAREIANKLNKKTKTIYYYQTPAYKRRIKDVGYNKRMILVETGFKYENN